MNIHCVLVMAVYSIYNIYQIYDILPLNDEMKLSTKFLNILRMESNLNESSNDPIIIIPDTLHNEQAIMRYYKTSFELV